MSGEGPTKSHAEAGARAYHRIAVLSFSCALPPSRDTAMNAGVISTDPNWF